MLRRTALFLAPLALATAPLAAQSGLSLVGGMTSATVSYTDDEGSANNLASRNGFAVGLGLGHTAARGLSFAPEVLYAMKGTNVKEWTDYTKLSYVSVPLMFRYALGGGGQATPFVTAGPTVSFLLSCTVGDDEDSESCDD